MTIKHAGLDSLLSDLTAKREGLMKAAAAKTAADAAPTSHPIGNADNNTSAPSTGARAAENTTDSKAQNALNPDVAGAPAATGPVAGSQGVDVKDATQAPADKPDTSGKSEMGSKDTSHPTKSASVLLKERIKAAASCGKGGKEGTPPVAVAAEAKKEGETVATESIEKKIEGKKGDEGQEGHTAEKVSAEKFAAYCEELIGKHPDDFQAGVKFASEVLEVLARAKTAGMDPAMMGGAPAPEGAPAPAADPAAMGGAPAPEGDPAAAGGAPGGDELDQLAQELEAAGVTPEQLAQALQDTEQAGGDVPQQDEGQMQALQQALQAEGMSPEELAAAMGGGAGAPGAEAAPAAPDTGAEDAAGAAAAKAASDKHAALVEEFRAQIRTIKAAKASGKK